MNIHVAQNLESQVEMKYLSSAKNHLISSQSSKPNMAIVQDSLLAAYKMTKGFKKLTKSQFYQILIHLDLPEFLVNHKDGIRKRIRHIKKVLRMKNRRNKASTVFSGKGLVSMFLPYDFNYYKKNEGSLEEPALKIFRGVIYEGVLNKAVIGSSHNSLIQVLYKEYGADTAVKFIDNMQFATNNFLLSAPHPSIKKRDGLLTDLPFELCTKCKDKIELLKKKGIKVDPNSITCWNKIKNYHQYHILAKNSTDFNKLIESKPNFTDAVPVIGFEPSENKSMDLLYAVLNRNKDVKEQGGIQEIKKWKGWRRVWHEGKLAGKLLIKNNDNTNTIVKYTFNSDINKDYIYYNPVSWWNSNFTTYKDFDIDDESDEEEKEYEEKWKVTDKMDKETKDLAEKLNDLENTNSLMKINPTFYDANTEYRGFTVGLGDCLISSVEEEEKIKKVIKKCYDDAENIKKSTSHPIIKEKRINNILANARNVGLKIAKDSLKKDNNFLSTVKSGSKGDYFNIAQITGLLGQQNLKGERVPLALNHGKRSLYHYPFGPLKPKTEYESRGFISSSFIKGLNPREFYFHAMSGREGISDTAMGTSKSGYIQRRIVKLTEDIKVEYDGTVRDSTGKIYQLSYGGYGIDPTKTVKVDGKQEICDVSRLVDKLNTRHKWKIK